MPRPYIPSLTGALGFSAATLAATAIPGPLNLGEVKINAQSLITDNATTEGSGSYTTGAMSTAVDPRNAAIGQRHHPSAYGRSGHE